MSNSSLRTILGGGEKPKPRGDAQTSSSRTLQHRRSRGASPALGGATGARRSPHPRDRRIGRGQQLPAGSRGASQMPPARISQAGSGTYRAPVPGAACPARPEPSPCPRCPLHPSRGCGGLGAPLSRCPTLFPQVAHLQPSLSSRRSAALPRGANAVILRLRRLPAPLLERRWPRCRRRGGPGAISRPPLLTAPHRSAPLLTALGLDSPAQPGIAQPSPAPPSTAGPAGAEGAPLAAAAVPPRAPAGPTRSGWMRCRGKLRRYGLNKNSISFLGWKPRERVRLV